MFNLHKNKAFTLIELLVVIAIIGILSSVVLAALSGARSSARDTTKIQKVDQIRTALEMYYNDNGNYPNGWSQGYAFSGATQYEAPCGYNSYWCDFLEVELAPYIDQLPRAEMFNSFEYLYKSTASGGSMYGLGVKLENASDVSENDGGFYSDRYEVGQLPSYCMRKYTGSDRNWTNWDNQSCSGDN